MSEHPLVVRGDFSSQRHVWIEVRQQTWFALLGVHLVTPVSPLPTVSLPAVRPQKQVPFARTTQSAFTGPLGGGSELLQPATFASARAAKRPIQRLRPGG